MTLTKIVLRYTLVLSLVVTGLQNKSYAGGFPMRPGRLLLSPSVSYFFANKQWDSHGKLAPFPGNGQFSSLLTSLYVEYGISRRWTFVGSLPYTINDYHQDDYHPGKDRGFTDLETGIKYYLANIGFQYYISVQGTVISPMYTNPNLGYGLTGGEFKLSVAGSGKLFGLYYYINLENGIRQYWGSNGPVQDRYYGTFGLTLDKRFREQIAVNFGGFYTTSSFNAETPEQHANPNTSTNFAFKQISLSYGHSFSKNFSVFLTGGGFISGRNTGAGKSGSIAFIYKIDTR